MDWTFWLLIVTALLNAIASLLAWAAKLRWSKEYSDAKDERLKARDDKIATLQLHIDHLKELSPANLKDHIAGITEIQERRVNSLKGQLEVTASELQELQSKIQREENKEEPQANFAIISGLEEERTKLENRIATLQSHIEQVQTAQQELRDQANLLPSIAYVRELNLVDKDGTVRALFTTLVDNDPSLLFYSKGGYEGGEFPLINLSLDSDGTGGLMLYDHNRKFQIELSTWGDEASLQIGRTTGPSYIQLIIREDGQPIFYISNSNGDTMAILELQNNRPPRFDIYQKGQKVWFGRTHNLTL